MKNVLKILCLCFSILIFVPMLKAQEITEIQKVKIEKKIDSLFKESIKSAENLDAVKLTAGVDDNHKAGFITGGNYYGSFDSLMTVFKSGIQGLNKQEIIVEKKKITVLSPTIVLLTATGNANATLNSGQTFSAKFFWSFIYEKINNEWKVIQSHQSNPR